MIVHSCIRDVVFGEADQLSDDFVKTHGAFPEGRICRDGDCNAAETTATLWREYRLSGECQCAAAGVAVQRADHVCYDCGKTVQACERPFARQRRSANTLEFRRQRRKKAMHCLRVLPVVERTSAFVRCDDRFWRVLVIRYTECHQSQSSPPHPCRSLPLPFFFHYHPHYFPAVLPFLFTLGALFVGVGIHHVAQTSLHPASVRVCC